MYDPAGQVTSTQINKADYVYNPVGNRTSLTDRRGAQAFGYDQLDRLTSASHPLLLDPQAFAYDAVGNRTTNGSVVNTGNQLTADANFAYQYDDNGNLTRKTLLATGNYSQYTYDAENRLTQVQEFAAGNPTAITTSSYRYDGLGRRIEKVANGQTKRYIYDGEDILLEYDGSNVLQVRYTHGPGIDEPLSRTPVTPGVGSGHQAVLASTPDGLRGPVVDDGITVNGQVSVGFVLASGVPTPAVGQPIDSTGSHQPVAPIDVTAASATGTLAVDLVDTGGIGGNAPVFLVTRDQATGQVIESRLLFPARATFASTTPLGTPLVVASTTVGVTTPVANGTLFYHQDGLGSVTDLTDSVGATAKSYSYDAYGNILESPGAVDQPYTYTGRELDSETGLYYYRARYYDATTGRFLQKDPVGLKAGPNGYWYANANPVFFVDPFGLMSRAQCDELRARIFRKVGDLIDDLIRYDPVADGIGGHPTSGGKKTSPGGHHNEIQERQWGIGKALAKYAKECTKRCNDGPPPPPLPEWVEEVATRPIPDVVYPIPQGPMLMGPVDSVPFPELPEFMVRPTFPRPFVIP